MQTRKHPRTLEEAFGPYARGPISSGNESGYGWLWRAAIALVCAAALVVIVNGGVR